MNRILYSLIPQKYALEKGVFPQRMNDRTVFVDMDKYDLSTIKDIKLMTNREVKANIVDLNSILENIERAYSNEGDVEKNIYERIVEEILIHAIKSYASDIHIEAFDDFFRVRERLEGELVTISKYPIDEYNQISSIIKLKAGCDITERRLPQDGRFTFNCDGNDVDIRLSTIPTVYGEKVELRLLDKNRFLRSRKELGFSDEAIKMMDKSIDSGRGMLIVTGATGSGKSSTLYSIVNEIRNRNINIVTIEDPVEYKIEGINQIQVNSKIGLGFDNGLRSILRQDPDFIVIGEIRDVETAKMAVSAAITGHFVMTTLHTNDVFATIDRLRDMGVEDYMLNSAITCIVSQKLVKKTNNTQDRTKTRRKLIYEILDFNEDVKDMLRDNKDRKYLKSKLDRENFISFDESIKNIR